MSGHSHWARIKRAKSVTDARRGRLWSKLSRAVIVAARSGGGDPDSNLTLRYAIDAAKIRRELSWAPQESFASGLRRTVQWYLDHAEWVKGVQSGEYQRWVELNYGARAQ